MDSRETTTTEAALTAHLSEDLRDAWDRLRETAASFGDQRIYASHKSIMFSRKSCYFFVRPKRSYLELCVFLARALKAPQVRRVEPVSKSKLAHFIHIAHRDEVEAPLTGWLREAYESAEAVAISGPAMQLTRVRRICHAIPGATEKLSHGAPAFFTPKRLFAMFVDHHHGGGHVAVWLPAADGAQAAFIEEAPATYFRPPYVGVKGWIGVELSQVDDEQLGALIREAFRLAHVKQSKPARKHGGGSRSSRRV